MASASDRHEVLSRLGIVEGGAESAFARSRESRRPFEDASIDSALESLPLESDSSSSLVQKILQSVSSRTAFVVLIAAIAVAALAALVVFNLGSLKTLIAQTAATTSTDPSPTPVANPPSRQTTSVKRPTQARPGSIAASARRERITANRTDRVGRVDRVSRADRADESSRPTVKAQQERSDVVKPVSSVMPAALPSETEEVANVVDETLYSKNDADVEPPRLLSADLPAAAIGGWTTRTNVIEVIVSENGSVERARFVATPQRMPDMFVLSRAKVWTFAPAMKEGRPVRYRLLLTWEVNP